MERLLELIEVDIAYVYHDTLLSTKYFESYSLIEAKIPHLSRDGVSQLLFHLQIFEKAHISARYSDTYFRDKLILYTHIIDRDLLI